MLQTVVFHAAFLSASGSMPEVEYYINIQNSCVDAGGGKLKFQVAKGHQKSKQTSIIYFKFLKKFQEM